MRNTVINAVFLAMLSNTLYAESVNPPAESTSQPAVEQQAQPASDQTKPETAAAINCSYQIPPEKTDIEPSIVNAWSKQAVIQAFDFNSATIDQQLEQLKACFTETGWQGYQEALQQSGNIDAIKSQNLTVSSQIDGEININPVKENQWKATIPLEVVYQNNKEKLTQKLMVNMLIGRKMTGELGIMQIIAAPRAAENADNSTKASEQTGQE
ncbi:DotI/IcmL family type IV secretion protein [Legionella londiniensis]|uniref:IcmL-like protein n=1 Tax=Legionella londiniensis TaxID=45068 RepID=A0A0W0VPB5_9GAMM|nr:DotI/IcmL family type IV secretion protein [Legionella londiniensis]KTD21882.1 IcmL-like protein [Legionella londiniensis]STX92635.1 IcmL-like protein [Legionella londiniensis]